MSTESPGTKLSNEISPPIAGRITVVATSTGAATLDLRTAGPQSVNMSSGDIPPATGGVDPPGLVGRYVDFFADAADVGIIFGATTAAVSSSNAPALATNGTNAAGCCQRIAAGTYRTWLVDKENPIIGYVAAASGQLRIVPSSRVK